MTHHIRFPDTLFHCAARAAAAVPVAISACLAGQPVRYDGTDKHDPAIYPLLAANLALQPLCPELDAGLGVPRPPVQLVAGSDGIRAQGRDDAALDVTALLQTQARLRADALLRSAPPLCGYIWKSRSPSCGWHSTPLYGTGKTATTSGLAAAEIGRRMPWLAMVEETTLHDSAAARAFILRCRLIGEVLDESLPLAALANHHSQFQQQLGATAMTELNAATRRLDRRGYAAVLNAAWPDNV